MKIASMDGFPLQVAVAGEPRPGILCGDGAEERSIQMRMENSKLNPAFIMRRWWNCNFSEGNNNYNGTNIEWITIWMLNSQRTPPYRFVTRLKEEVVSFIYPPVEAIVGVVLRHTVDDGDFLGKRDDDECGKWWSSFITLHFPYISAAATDDGTSHGGALNITPYYCEESTRSNLIRNPSTNGIFNLNLQFISYTFCQVPNF